MKVAINRCYGGFSLSHKAIEMLMKRKGLDCYRYKHSKFSFQDGVDEYIRCDGEVKDDTSNLFVHYYTKDYGKKVSELPEETYWSYSNLERNDSDLISVIEELGDDASGKCGDIKVVEIPDDVAWTIEEYDGMESIHEQHRVWC